MLALAGCRAEASVSQEPAPSATPAFAKKPTKAEGWNADEITWVDYASGLNVAKALRKPVFLVLSATWCPHCKNYSHVFDDPRVVEKAKRFVMVHVDADEHMDLSTQFKPDGAYVPRTFFLSADGKPNFDIRAPRDRFSHFYDEHDPSGILASMDEALNRAN
jgi:protein-disulfide reductase (glutathione)